jgi:hypothetical protein
MVLKRVLFGGSLVAAACALDVDAEGEGKACDASGRCASGYVCNAEARCVKSEHTLPEGGGGNGGSGGGAGAGGGSGGSIDAAVDAPCPDPTTYFPDADGDGFGHEPGARIECDAPAGQWVTQGGDCADAVADAFPGQTAYFGTGFDDGGSTSFDYDCSGSEEPDPAQPELAPNCTSLTVLQCSGEGYEQTGRTGNGVDPTCGSTTLIQCVASLTCGFDTETAPAKRCR